DAEGESDDGHAPAGNEHQRPPAAATARTHWTLRAAKAPRPPNCTRKTRSRAGGTKRRACASRPRAQPVKTCAPVASWASTKRSAATLAGAGARDPETPTTAAEERSERTVDKPHRQEASRRAEA